MKISKFFLRIVTCVVALYPASLFPQAQVTDDTFSLANHHSNFGDSAYLAVQGPSSTTYIRFDLACLPHGITGEQVNKATVRLWVSGVTHAGSFDVRRVMSSWSENTLTGQNLPLLGMSDANDIQISKNSKNHYLIIDITPLVKDWVNNSQPNYGIALVPVGNVSVAFDSKENNVTSHDPELRVELEKVGPMGPQGPAGTAGPAGAGGPQGPAGATGPAGLAGAIGPQGPAGPVGPAGAIGPPGPAGPVGSAGAIGPQGPAGPVGSAGAIGPQGPAGPTGVTGAQGLPGPIGLTGPAGSAGPAGAIGPQGPAGPQGTPGAAGPQGLPGAAGPAGPVGPSGAIGPQGPSGPQGPAGPQGTSGPIGQTGATGSQGPVGPQGPPGPVNYPGAASLTATHTLSPVTVINLSAEGTRDWFAPAGSMSGNYHSKLLGGQLMKSFDWVGAGMFGFTQGSAFAINSAAADDATGFALAGFGTDQGFLSSGSDTGFGFRLRAPADNGGSRTLKVYCSMFSGAATLTARLTDGSAADVTDKVDVGANGFNYFVWTVNYESARDGQELEVSVLLTANHGSTPNVKFTAATLH